MATKIERPKLTLLERLYLPALWNGFKVTLRHFFSWKKSEVYADKNEGYDFKATLKYPEELWTVPKGFRGAPYLVKDQNDATKCVSCQLCEFVCPPKAIRIVPPGEAGAAADRANAEKLPKEFEIDMLRCIFCGYCEEVCPEEAIFLAKDYYEGYDKDKMRRDYALTGTSRKEMIYDKEKLLELGGVHHDEIRKWEKKQKDADAQENFPVND
jgi:NADH-quinone oxidoreductase subunit I